MRLLLLLAFSIAFGQLHAQWGPKFTYLILEVRSDWDYEAKKSYLQMLPEPANPYAQSFYDLVPFINERSVTNNKDNYYPAIKDTARGIYNYFANQSQVLQFATDEGWELVQVVQQIDSAPATESVRDTRQVYTKIKYPPGFLFAQSD
ncbi:hypothetical protein [Paracnuella aquatica]|uniref:hypothetical protein n=1 Tax=Paracnuella aquatica TaxID=2268757 RepID=UPI000DEECE9E|nr:hypothetical protein [Paracnuella aquatica]RPD51395.1 hypothetical protein DRJ53_01545 [Paracnuella aquatica]